MPNDLVHRLREAEKAVSAFINDANPQSPFNQLDDSAKDDWCLFAEVIREQLKFNYYRATQRK